jgi:hypothetical protein
MMPKSREQRHHQVKLNVNAIIRESPMCSYEVP